ncbi:MAG: hypothetical protein LBE38_11115 [Deltaproteobacteria bacterium]|nr:hypothetical protein [Deltaproteobacteria bacterium]
MYKKENPPGIRIEEVVNDAAKELGIKTKPFCSIEQRLQTIVESFVENNFTKLPVDSQIELLKKVNLPCDQITTIIDGVKNKKLSVIPVLISAAGPTLTAIFVDALLTKLITKMISKKASDSIIKEVSSKLPLKLLGPVMWWASTLWIANSLFLGPVKRKTVRVVLHLGLISLRNSDTQN